MCWANLSGSTLIGPDTINTLPPDTLAAYRDHGKRLPACGVDIDEVTQRLEDEGVEKFIKPFELLLSALRSRKRA